MPSTASVTTALGAVLLILGLQGCADLKPAPVKPWERGILSEPNMQLTINPLETYADEHIYFSKEAATGGASVGGGGCGCN